MPTGSHAVRNQEKILWNKKDVNPNWGLQSHQIPLNHSRNWWDRWAQHLSKHFQIELAVFNKKHIRTFGVKPWKKDHLTYHWTSARIPPIPGNLTSCFKVKVLWKENVLCIFLCTYIQLYIYIYIYSSWTHLSNSQVDMEFQWFPWCTRLWFNFEQNFPNHTKPNLNPPVWVFVGRLLVVGQQNRMLNTRRQVTSIAPEWKPLEQKLVHASTD